jgi:hypothetical protein
MIDDPGTVHSLMERMEAHLPIPAFPTSELARLLRQRGMKIGSDRVLFIKRVFYHGDEGGIVCDVTPTRDAEAAYVVSLTHLRIPPGHPLSQEIRAYQRERVRRIAESGQ